MSDLQRDMQRVEACIENHVDVIDARDEWDRIKARLNPDREAVARAIDMATLQKLPVHQLIAATEAAIAAMKGETP